MWDMLNLLDRIKDMLQEKINYICMFLAFIIPYGINFINRKMHQVGDPPWKKEEDSSRNK